MSQVGVSHPVVNPVVDARNWNGEQAVFSAPSCYSCADPLPAAYIYAKVYGEGVVVCSSRCLMDLQRVWAPAQRQRDFSAVVRFSLGVLAGMVLAI